MTIVSHYQIALCAEYCYYEQTISKNNVECFIQYYNETAVIAIRGSERITERKGLVDWIRDVIIFPTKFRILGWCHAGFGDGAWRIATPIMKAVDKKTPIILTGHSAGGIISLMVAKILVENGFNVVEWVGFGAPRGFIGKLQWDFKLTAYRYGKDIVTYVPTLGYRHQVELTKFANDRWYPNWNDHWMSHYIEKMSSLTENIQV